MKKIFLTLLAINAAFSYSETSGNIELDSSYLLKKDFKSGALEHGYKTKNRAGIFFGNEKSTYIFAGANKNDDGKSIYGGASYDGKINDNFELGIFLGARRPDGVEDLKKEEELELKNEFINHLSEKNKYREDMNDFAKMDALKRAGYINERNKNHLFILSAKGRVNRTNIYFTSSYTSNNFKENTHRVYNYFETDSMLNQGFLNAKLESDFNTEKINPKKIYNIKDNKKNKKDETKKLEDIKISDNGGSLKGALKFSSSRLIPDTFFYNELKFDLKSGILAKDNGNRFVDVDFKNYFKYSGVKNLNIIGKVDYELKHQRYLGEDPSDKNTVRLSSEFNYDNKKISNSILFKIDNSVEVKNKSLSTSQGYELKNKFEYRPIKELGINLDAHLKTYISFKAYSDALVNIGYNTNGRKGRFLYNSKTNVKYRLFSYKSQDDHTHNVFTLTENKFSYINRDLKLEYKLNSYSELVFGNKIVKVLEVTETGENESEARTKPKPPKPKPPKPNPSKPKQKFVDKSITFKEHLVYVNTGLKTTYKKDNLSITNDIDGYYALDSYDTNEHSFGLLVKNDLGYDFNNISLNVGLDLDYRYNKLSIDEYNNFANYVDNAGFIFYRYYNYREKTNDNENEKIVYSYNSEKKFTVEDKPEKLQRLEIIPRVSAEFKFLENKLTLNPGVKVKNIFKNDNLKNKLELNNINTEFNMNLKYSW